MTPLSKPEINMCSRSGDGRMESYRYRGYEWTIERGWFMWWCHSGISIPTDPFDEFWEQWTGEVPLFELCGICHEAGWGSFTKRALLRKLRRTVNKDIAQRIREREVAHA